MSRRRKLSPEEDALWRQATRDVARYQPQKSMEEKIVSKSNQDRGPQKYRVSPLLPPAKAAGRVNRLASGDPRFDRLAGKGRLEIDAVLDLHGHTQGTARAALHRFVTAGHARGARCLLVITGKGAAATGPHSGRGVLRARFSDWINEEPVRALISRAAKAHQRHGGDGAFYVFLKR